MRWTLTRLNGDCVWYGLKPGFVDKEGRVLVMLVVVEGWVEGWVGTWVVACVHGHVYNKTYIGMINDLGATER